MQALQSMLKQGQSSTHSDGLNSVMSMDTSHGNLHIGDRFTGRILEVDALSADKSGAAGLVSLDEITRKITEGITLSFADDGDSRTSTRKGWEFFCLVRTTFGLHGWMPSIYNKVKRGLEARLQSATDNIESLMNQLKESEKIVGSLQTDLETVRDLKAMFETQNENQKLTKEGADPQLTVARVELNEAHRKLSSLEMELENQKSCCEDTVQNQEYYVRASIVVL
ncbi:FILAMENT-LIKE PLANT PROTEIN 4 [Salix viminalis]|uniref:FILAMENT-LIKE PLANT PROTEIN 4 n=1 Tax=Salix viminalis TaxID=40686 RepID=A0A9Q0NYV9_SALVM|nr:FILAMENT-LIKE PLANT PROTEIN 4 [Salix viminalis]